VQQQYTYLLPLPGHRQDNLITEELRDYAIEEGLTLLAYSPQLAGFYGRTGKTSLDEYNHAANRARLAGLRQVAAEVGATPTQVNLAWIMQGEPSIIPIAGASSVAQLDEILGATELRLDADVRARLDAAGRTDDSSWDEVGSEPPGELIAAR
jgi:aryl-alcohol dehydrogenase-like predicted oxidoreductase